MKVAKSILRNDGYNLTPIDFTIYLKLLELQQQMSDEVVYLDLDLFKKSTLINDARTIKKSLHNLFMNGLVINRIERFNRNYTEIIINHEINNINENIEIEEDIFNHLEELGYIGLRIVCYLMTYYDYLLKQYPKFIPFKKICNDLLINHESLKKYIAIIQNNEYYSFLVDKDSSLGKNFYYLKIKEQKDKTKKHMLENQLEKELISNIELIEKGMKLIDNQYQINDGKIDILCRDENGNLCIIELKVVENDEKLVF